MLDPRHRQRSRWHQLHAPGAGESTRQERHERRLSARLEL
jgi:hypothetical protein